MNIFILSLMILCTGGTASAAETTIASYCQGDVKPLRDKYNSEHGSEAEASREQGAVQAEAARIRGLLSDSKAYKELVANHASLNQEFFQKKIGELLDSERKSFFKSTDSEEHSVVLDSKGLIAIRSAKKKANSKAESECKDKARENLKHVAGDCKYDPGVMFDHVPLARCVSTMKASYKYRVETLCHEEALAIVTDAKLVIDPLTLEILPRTDNVPTGDGLNEYLKKNLDPNCFVGSKPPSQATEASGPKRASAPAAGVSQAAGGNAGAVRVE